MRPLTLHTSALSDDEYSFYTSNISDLARCDGTLHEDEFYEQITISVRETRAWLRGRYPNIPIATIDAIINLFLPLKQGDALSGGQFFAALRLVIHVQNGRELDRSLAFVQAQPLLPWTHQQPGPSASSNNPFVTRAKSLSYRPEAGSSNLPSLPPRKTLSSASSLSLPSLPKHGSMLPPPTPPPLKPKPAISPLIQQSLTASKAAKTIKRAEEQLEKERVLQVLKSSTISSPFISESRETNSPQCVLEAKLDSSASEGEVKDVPPALPRRRLRHSPTVSASSLEQVALAAPPRPIQLPLDARLKSVIDLPPPTHPDRKLPFSASIHIDNEKSFEPIYTMSRRSSLTSPPQSTPSPSASPLCSFSGNSATMANPIQQRNRMFRSRSLHSNPTTFPPTASIPMDEQVPPIPLQKPPLHHRRKRPESLQLTPSPRTGRENLGTFGGHRPMITTSSSNEAQKSIFASSPETLSSEQQRLNYRYPFNGNHHLIAGTSGDLTTAGTIQKKLQELQLSALPVLEKAKYKAEASLSPRRGFISSIPASSSGIVSGAGIKARCKGSLGFGQSGGEERDGLLLSDDENIGQDSGDDDDDNHTVTLKEEEWRVEPLTGSREQMKWPPGEGWNRL